jgi:DNA-directed RNA polymerase
MLKQLGILDTVTDLRSRRTKSTTPDSETTDVRATATAGEEGAAENDCNEAKEEGAVVVGAAAPTAAVSVVSKEQVIQLLKPGSHDLAVAIGKRRSRSKSKSATATATKTPTLEASNEDSSLDGKFVDLVDLLLPVPIKGEFDVNKIKSSLYFFS